MGDATTISTFAVASFLEVPFYEQVTHEWATWHIFQGHW